jgi:hypothetical protein
MFRAETAAVESKAGAKGLRRGAIGLTSGVVIGLASAAPAYSLAASLGVLVVLVGEKAPAVMLVAFVPMVLIAVAYKELNKAEPDCGTHGAGGATGATEGRHAGPPERSGPLGRGAARRGTVRQEPLTVPPPG